MINTELKKSQVQFDCDSCGGLVEKEAPYWMLEFEAVGKIICICEDCGNDLQTDMNDDYSKFVDMER